MTRAEIIRKKNEGKLMTYLEGNGKSVTQIAELVGVTKAHMANIVSGRGNPSVEVAKKILAVTGVELLASTATGTAKRKQLNAKDEKKKVKTVIRRKVK
jgi:transcriptional regulator with XRE-family HTH domain